MKKLIIKNLNKIIIATTIIITAGAFIVLTVQFVKINALNSEYENLNDELIQLIYEREGLEAQEYFLDNSFEDFIEEYVRRYLGWKKDGETVLN